MLIDFALDHRDRLGAELSAPAWSRTAALLDGHPAPAGLGPGPVLAVAGSELLDVIASSGSRIVSGVECRRIDSIPPPDEGEYARLMHKGRVLFEHCLMRRSEVCVTGFLEHQLGRGASVRRLVLDFLGWMVEQRVAVDGSEPAARPELVTRMIESGVRLLHGLDVAAE